MSIIDNRVTYDGLTPFKTTLYGVGHVLNDLCAACWFNYVLYFLANVQQVSNSAAGAVILAGQLADGIATPLVGMYSDRFDTRFGKRKPWYMFGTVVVPVCFLFIWQQCLICIGESGGTEVALQILWYSFFAAFFNVGWAAIQVSHLALIPTLTPLKQRKDRLIGLRTAFTYISNITVLLMALLLFNIISSPKVQFSVLSILVLVIGVSINILFILYINEVSLSEIASASYRTLQNLLHKGKVNVRSSWSSSIHSMSVANFQQHLEIDLQAKKKEKKDDIKWSQWVRKPQIYVIGSVYMLARLANNAVTAMLPFYLTTVLSVGGVSDPDQASDRTPWQLALIPMCLYIGSAGMSMTLKRIGEKIDRKIQYLIGAGFVLVGALPMLFLTHSTQYVMIPVAIVLGIGLSFQLNNSFGFIAAFIGSSGTSGAFVWGYVSLFDKFCTGLILFGVVSFGDLESSIYIRIIVGGIPIVASFIGGFVTFFVGKTNEFTAVDDQNQEYTHEGPDYQDEIDREFL